MTPVSAAWKQANSVAGGLRVTNLKNTTNQETSNQNCKQNCVSILLRGSKRFLFLKKNKTNTKQSQTLTVSIIKNNTKHLHSEQPAELLSHATQETKAPDY